MDQRVSKYGTTGLNCTRQDTTGSDQTGAIEMRERESVLIYFVHVAVESHEQRKEGWVLGLQTAAEVSGTKW